ncbi:TrfB-related DNA-binding protein [Burkholderia sp. BCC1993]|uniref:TrfB-related DNA-binding protein n=1 Tax=Burkholderia sp. BCC1993 TaxID=2817444 RepID=UPI002AB041CA|nr:TrfB-related DNA-binding protein [Burkholderia sp. BCC1993]
MGEAAMSKVMRRITAAEFAAVRPTLILMKIAEPRIEAARAVMVDGKSIVAVAREQGWTKQAVSNTVRRVWEFHEAQAKGQATEGPEKPVEGAYAPAFAAPGGACGTGVVVLPDDAPDAVVAALVRVALSAAKGAPVTVVRQVREDKKKPAR